MFPEFSVHKWHYSHGLLFHWFSVLRSQCCMITDPCSRALGLQRFTYPKSLLCYIPSVPCSHLPIVPYLKVVWLPEFSAAGFPKILFSYISWSPCCNKVLITWRKTAIKPDLSGTVFIKLWWMLFAIKGCFEVQLLVTHLTPAKTLFTSITTLRTQKNFCVMFPTN